MDAIYPVISNCDINVVKVKWIYIVPSREASKALRYESQFYLQITPCLPLPRKHSPDGATGDL